MQVSRDPFARTELHRAMVGTSRTCDWCGQARKSGKLFAYRTETDGGRTSNHPGMFCSISCFRAYHE